MKRKMTSIVLVCAVTLAGWFVLCDSADAQARREGPQRMGRRPSPEQMEQFRKEMAARMADRMREDLGFTAEEWTLVGPLVEKVMNLDRQLAPPRERMMGGRRMGRRPMGEGPTGEGRMGEGPRGPRGDQRPRPERTDDSELGKARQALRKVADDEAATAEQITAALKTYRAERAKVELQRKAARTELREVLDARQEAKLVMMGVLD